MIGKWVGSYEVKGLIGEGASSIVYRGLQPSLGRPVAIKMLKLFQAGDGPLRERFRAEALAQSKLSHPNIVLIYDFIRQYDNYFIIMELLPGRSLKEVISEKGAMAPEELLSVFICVLEAIESAHKKGVIHGDIRPSNVFVDSEGTVKVTDFGISKIIGATGMAPFTTTEGQVRYVSPEQIRRQPVDERSDIYSLGVLLYELATGKPPFLGQSAFEIMDKHINQLPPPARNVRPELPKNIADAIGKALQKSPAERFQSAKEFEAFLKGDTTFSEVIRLNSQGFKFYNQGNYRAAIATWELVLKLDPNNAKAQGGIARARAHLEEAGEKSIFEAALEEVAEAIGGEARSCQAGGPCQAAEAGQGRRFGFGEGFEVAQKPLWRACPYVLVAGDVGSVLAGRDTDLFTYEGESRAFDRGCGSGSTGAC